MKTFASMDKLYSNRNLENSLAFIKIKISSYASEWDSLSYWWNRCEISNGAIFFDPGQKLWPDEFGILREHSDSWFMTIVGRRSVYTVYYTAA